MKKRRKSLKEQGITLIALVVTIIIMLILAGVALYMALGDNGLIKQAKFAKNEYEKAAKSEGNILSNGGMIYENLYDIGMYQTNNLILLLDGKLNTKEIHSNETDTWYDISGVSGKNATKSKGTSKWSEKSLILKDSTTYTVDAPVNDSFGTVEVCVKIDKDFKPGNYGNWYESSTIFGCEKPGYQKDWAIVVDKDGKFAVTWTNDSIISSDVTATDGNIHTITYSYLPNKFVFAVDGKIEKSEDLNNQLRNGPIEEFGIGWNNSDLHGEKSILQEEIYCIRFYDGELTEEDIKNNYNEDQESFQ